MKCIQLDKVLFAGFLTLLVAFISQSAGAQNTGASPESYKYRPLYHFSPANGWIGDPDGLVYQHGTYHLFWWGHAISKDLVHWQEMPKPMQGDDKSFAYFSGSVAIDRNNTSGFGANSMIAVYTRHLAGDSLPETQALSISTNGGLTFNYYAQNPVLDIHKIFFRDPQVFWYAPDRLWKMVVILPDIQQIHLYESKDLKNWNYCSSFGSLGAKNSFWECPDLFELPVTGTRQKKWVMMIGRGPNKVQYFTGQFNGKVFTPDTSLVSYLNSGKGLPGVVFDDFENGFAKWQNAGTAFQATRQDKQITDYLGKYYAGTPSRDNAKGILQSKPFIIRNNAINFLLAGGNHPDTTCVRLVVNKQVVRTATGDNTQVLKWHGWDVQELIGKQAYLEIVDRSTDTLNGNIAVDHIIFAHQLLNQQLEHALWTDYGADLYATRTWRNYDAVNPSGDTVIALSWMGNWSYANKTPTTWGKGFESLPRRLMLQKTAFGYTLIQQPLSQFEKLRTEKHVLTFRQIKGASRIPLFEPRKNCYEIIAEFKPSANAVFGLDLLVGNGRRLPLRYYTATSVLTLDRSNCTDFTSDPQFTKAFSQKMNCPLTLSNGVLRLHIFVDQSSIEIFANNGERVMSATTFPSDKQLGLHLVSEKGTTQIINLTSWQLNSVYPQPQ